MIFEYAGGSLELQISTEKASFNMFSLGWARRLFWFELFSLDTPMGRLKVTQVLTANHFFILDCGQFDGIFGRIEQL